jgi:AraC family transcriptional activator of pobA
MADIFFYRKTTLKDYLQVPYSGSLGFIIHVLHGSANVMIAFEEKEIKNDDEVFILPHLPFCLLSRSTDFEIEVIAFPYDVYQSARLGLPPKLELHLRHYNLHQHTRGDVYHENFMAFMAMGRTVAREKENEYWHIMQTDFIRLYLLYLYDKCQKNIASTESGHNGRQEELFYRFLDLLDNHCQAEHTVTYYASSLAITPRYLNLIVNRLTSNESAKDIIDQRLILEIKSLLSYTDKSIQQIAIMLHFPDVSYLGRFFRRHTGMNASEYREKHNSRG